MSAKLNRTTVIGTRQPAATMLKALAALGLVVAAMTAFSSSAQAQVVMRHTAQGGYVNVQHRGPPPNRYEAVPAPRRGYVWAGGHWEPRGQRHVWVKGHWVKARPGYAYRQPSWNHGKWSQARWDRDGDGVPDRHDRRPNNPNRH